MGHLLWRKDGNFCLHKLAQVGKDWRLVVYVLSATQKQKPIGPGVSNVQYVFDAGAIMKRDLIISLLV